MSDGVILLLALAIDGVVGDPKRLWDVVPHPVVWMGRAISLFEEHANKAHMPANVRRWNGVFCVAMLVGVAWLAATLAQRVVSPLPFGWVLEAVIASIFIAQKSLHDHVVAVAQGLEQGGLDGGRRAVAMIVGRDPASLDEAGVSRAAIESTAENFSDGVVAPAFWFLVAGLPGIVIYKAINTADSMIGHKSDRYRDFGRAAARIDDLANWLPARLSALLIALAATILPGADPSGAMTAARRDAGKHRSVNAGWPEAAMAGALGIRLAGPRSYDGEVVEDAWMGDGRADLDAADIRRALALFVLSCAELALVVALLAMLV